MRLPFFKKLMQIKVEDAHKGSGKRQLILSKDDSISQNLEAMTKGFLPPKGIFDWHMHKGVDEFFLVLKGTGIIEFENKTKIEYSKNDLIYIPANTEHKIENIGGVENEFFFIRLKA